MKVLHLFDHSIPLHSGYTFRSLSILKSQRAIGIETAQLTSIKQGKSTNAVETVDGLDFHRTVAAPQRNGGVAEQLRAISSMTNAAIPLAQKFRPDIIHAHSPSLCGWAAWRTARKLNIPFVYEIRAFWEDAAVDAGKTKEGSILYKATRALETQLVKRVDGLMCICQGLKDDLDKREIAKTIGLIPNSIDTSRFLPIEAVDEPLANKLGLTDAPVLGFIGSFYPYEGLDLLVKALPNVLKTIPNAKLLLVGGGVTETDIRKLVQDLGLGNSVIFTGRVPHDEVPAYTSVVSAFVFPRKKMRLTDLVTPLKPLEAMSQGRVVIASNVGGHRELIAHGENGFLFEADNVEALAATLITVLNSPKALTDEIIARAKTFVKNERDWSITVKRYLPIYESAIRSAKSG